MIWHWVHEEDAAVVARCNGVHYCVRDTQAPAGADAHGPMLMYAGHALGLLLCDLEVNLLGSGVRTPPRGRPRGRHRPGALSSHFTGVGPAEEAVMPSPALFFLLDSWHSILQKEPLAGTPGCSSCGARAHTPALCLLSDPQSGVSITQCQGYPPGHVYHLYFSPPLCLRVPGKHTCPSPELGLMAYLFEGLLLLASWGFWNRPWEAGRGKITLLGTVRKLKLGALKQQGKPDSG